MAATHRLRYDGLLAGTDPPKLGVALTDGVGTTITFPAALKHSGAVAVPTIADPDYLPLIVDPDTDALEIVWLTAYTAGATSGTIARGKEDTAGIAHIINAPVVHGSTAFDLDNASLDIGGAVSYTFLIGDEANAASWFGSGVGVHLLPTWTPVVGGDILLVFGPDNGDSDWTDGNFSIYIWKGNVAGVDYPDPTAASVAGGTSWERDVYPSGAVPYDTQAFSIVAGQPYTIMLIDWNSPFAGHVIDLSGLYNSLAPFGGLADPPPPYTGQEPSVVGLDPDGNRVRKFLLPTGLGTGERSVAEMVSAVSSGRRTHAEAYGNASGDAAHAEGSGWAAGWYTHAEGFNAQATADAAHAEGYSTVASGAKSHAEGQNTVASGMASHAQGLFARAWRTAEHAESSDSGTITINFQASRLTLGCSAPAGTPTILTMQASGSVPLQLTPSKVSIVKGVVIARCRSTGDSAAWKYELLAEMGAAGATPTFVGSPAITLIAADTGASTWGIAITATADALRITGTGDATHATLFAATAEILEIVS